MHRLRHPGTGELVARAVLEATRTCGMPEGVYSFLMGGIDTGTALVARPHIKAVGFTGSRGAGLALSAIAAARSEPIPVYAEMSSVNPVLLLPAAIAHRPEEIASGYVASVTLGSGQFCTNPGLLLAIDGPDLDTFLGHARRALARISPAPMLTENIHRAFAKGVNTLRQHAAVTVVATGAKARGANRSPAQVFVTTSRAFLSDPTLGEEVFGASSLVIRCQSPDEIKAVLDAIEGQLTVTLQMDDDDLEIARGFVPLLEMKAGRLARQPLAHQRRSQFGHGSWRAVSGNIGQPIDFGRHNGDPAILATNFLPELPQQPLARRSSIITTAYS